MKRNLQKVVSSLCAVSMTAMMLAGCGNTATDTLVTGDDVADDAVVTDVADGTDSADSTDAAPADLINQTAEEDVPQLDGYTLLWHDEFNGTTLDETNWNKELRNPGWTNNELQAYVAYPENIYVKDGLLTLQALKEVDENGNVSYTSGKVNSQNLRDFTYGKVVVSARTPEGKGLWPAIWMMPQNESHYGQWPKCGEIDIMEVLCDQTDLAYQTIHYGEPHGEQQGTYTLTNGTFASDFHEYSVEWEPGEMRFFIDDNLVLTVNDWYTCEEGQEYKPYPAPFDQPFFVQMNLAVGGNWPGNPDENTDFDNAKFEIDYVRVYQMPEYDTNVSRPEKVFREPNEDGNYVNNGDFAVAEELGDDLDWQFLLFADGEGSAEITDNMVVITSENAGTEDYSVQFLQADMPVRRGSTYRVTFDACAEEDRTMILSVTAPNVGWIRYFPDTKLDLTTDWQSYEYTFEMTENDDNASRLEFNMGNQGSTATIKIANVRFEEVME